MYRRPTQSALAIVLFGVLGWLLGRRTDTITIDMVLDEGRSLAVVQGVAPLRLRRAFLQLQADLCETSPTPE